ncbi:MAG: sodium:calcium antiporter [Candidatus Altiarchaeota archaeon]|nr:sodium:calcium antiporter [Candidatus Altiarchaeota archaeon]
MIWLISLLVIGVVVMTYSSDKVVKYGKKIATALQIHPFLVGLTLVSLGTDLPEITNSIMASFLGHGDINVGDSLGSTLAQITIIMGLLTLFGKSFKIDRREILTSGSLLILALLFFSWLASDGFIGRLDAALLILFWLLSIVFLDITSDLESVHHTDDKRMWGYLGFIFVSFIGVAIGAYFTIDSIIKLSVIFHLPEYFVSFFVIGIGTSLPELVVGMSALKRGESELAVGDFFGSSLIDATVSIAAGALAFPIMVSAAYIVPTALLIIFATAAVTSLLVLVGKENKLTGLILVLIYVYTMSKSFSILS